VTTVFERLRGRRLTGVGTIGLVIVSIVIILAIIGPYVSPHDPIQHHLQARYKPLGYTDENGTFVLGTDQLGRDILSRIIAGCRVSVIVSIFAVVIAGSIGVSYGLIAGFVGGWVDQIMMRIADALLSIPFIVLVVAISGVVGAGIFTLVLILGFTGWVTYARVTRGEVLVAKELDYVIASRSI